jgi:hypothetical protein
VFEHHPVARAADPDAVTTFVASIAGYFTRMSLMPPPAGLPTMRLFQAAQGRVARRWIAQRQGSNIDDMIFADRVASGRWCAASNE